jgi:hypothetical protein
MRVHGSDRGLIVTIEPARCITDIIGGSWIMYMDAWVGNIYVGSQYEIRPGKIGSEREIEPLGGVWFFLNVSEREREAPPVHTSSSTCKGKTLS